MKNLLKISSVFILAFVFMSTSLPKKKENIQGLWRMVSGITNGIPNPPVSVDRMQEFKKDNTFEGKIYLPDGIQTYNTGVYSMLNDSTIVTVHENQPGKLSPIAFKYNYSIKNDTLHFYGHYLTGAQNNPGLLRMVHLDELWVKERFE